MNQESVSAINTLIGKLNLVFTLDSNIEVVWVLEKIAGDALNEANKIRHSLESEQAKD